MRRLMHEAIFRCVNSIFGWTDLAREKLGRSRSATLLFPPSMHTLTTLLQHQRVVGIPNPRGIVLGDGSFDNVVEPTENLKLLRKKNLSLSPLRVGYPRLLWQVGNQLEGFLLVLFRRLNCFLSPLKKG